jgi:RNA recognition motif-containing protein
MSKLELDKIFIGKLPYETNVSELEKKFLEFGKITNIILKLGYAFIVIFLNSLINLDIQR